MRHLIVLFVCLLPNTAHAYIGPGAGITALGSLLALAAALLLAAIGFVWYPAKRLLSRRSKRRVQAAERE